MFADNLKKARLKRGLSQKALAAALPMTQQGYCRYENGTAAPSPEIINRLAVLLGVPVAELLGDEKTPTVMDDGERSVLDVSSLSPENRDKLEEYMRLLLMSQDK